MKEFVGNDIDKYLLQFEVKKLLSENFKVMSFRSGVDLLPIKPSLAPKLVKLWASALSRDLNDRLVLEDSEEYPFRENNSVILVQDRNNSDLVSIFLYRPILNNTDSSKANGIYLNICLVDERYQWKGLTSSLTQMAIREFQPEFLVLHSQNEIMVQTLRKFCPKGSLFPIDGNLPNDYNFLTQQFTKIPSNFDPSTLVEKSLYCNGAPLCGDRLERHSNHEDIRNFFEKNVDFQKGDSVLVIGFLNQIAL